MAKKVGPYVGVTGFMSRTEVSEALAMVPQGSTRRLMVGVLASSKTLAGQHNKWPGRYPKREAIASILTNDARALNLVHYSTDRPETLFTQLVGAHLPMIDAILVDSSGGKGKPFDAVKGAEYLRAARKHPTLGIGIAGGLGPETLHLLDPLVKEFPELSIDAEGRLRTRMPEDALRLDAMRTYLEDAFPILAGKSLNN